MQGPSELKRLSGIQSSFREKKDRNKRKQAVMEQLHSRSQIRNLPTLNAALKAIQAVIFAAF